jgi:hypothetical protein
MAYVTGRGIIADRRPRRGRSRRLGARSLDRAAQTFYLLLVFGAGLRRGKGVKHRGHGITPTCPTASGATRRSAILESSIEEAAT